MYYEHVGDYDSIDSMLNLAPGFKSTEEVVSDKDARLTLVVMEVVHFRLTHQSGLVTYYF